MVLAKNVLKNCALVLAIVLSQLNCTTHYRTADAVKVSDTQPSYDIKISAPTQFERFRIVAEHQQVAGEAPQHFLQATYIDYSVNPQGETKIREATTTNNEFTLAASSLGVKWNLLNDSRIGINMYFNALSVGADVDINSEQMSRQSLHQRTLSFAPKFEIYFPINKDFRVVGSVSDLIHNAVDFETAGIFVEYSLNKNVAFELGFKTWFYNYEAPASKDTSPHPSSGHSTLVFNDVSDINIKSKGLSAGASFSF